MNEAPRKVTAGHLGRDAYLYVRQSTVRQVYENTESTRRQYALRERAVALGWPADRVVVIDTDLGRSGADRDRDGFQRLVAEVGMGRAGIVLGLEVSRLARNSTDWHRLLEICALSDTPILDEDGVYDPRDFNDRLLLGLKGTMSEAELHMPHARLRGGLLNRARRGAPKLPLPVGPVYDPLDRVVLAPDAQVRRSLRLLFDAFARTGSATATVKYFRQRGLRFPRRPRNGPRKGELHWQPLEHSRVLHMLHNPRYAGAYAFGRSRQRRRPGGAVEWRRVPIGEWTVLPRDAHPGYIGRDRYEANRRQLRDNARAHGADRRRGPPREGPALLQGLAVCGVCGRGMTVRYHMRRGTPTPDYVCQRDGVQTARAKCQSIPGAGIDRAVGALLVELMTPVTLTVALKVRDELEARAEQTDAWRAQAVERARDEAELARRRFMQAHPDNRLVADVLEAEWNAKLRELDDARRELEQRRGDERGELDEGRRRRILGLAADFPRLWNDPATPDRERKRMARLLVEDVTITRDREIALGIRLRGGATRELRLAPEPPAWQRYRTPERVVARIDSLLERHTDAEIAALLNDSGMRTGRGATFRPQRVRAIRREYRLSSRHERLRARGLLNITEVAAMLGVSTDTVKRWRRRACSKHTATTTRTNVCTSRPATCHPSSSEAGGRPVDVPRTTLPLNVPMRCGVKHSPSLAGCARGSPRCPASAKPARTASARPPCPFC